MTALLDVVMKFFRERDVPIEQLEDTTVFRGVGDGANGSWTLWVEVREDDELCLVWSSYSEAVDEARRPAVMELITRVNPDIEVGAFEMDLDRGNVSFKTSIDVTGDRLSEALFERLIGHNVQSFDDYLPAIEEVARDGVDPKDVVLAFRG
ncbi:MAG: hypothetical protein QOI95_351 [Acidimicrobiaceae bacterium]|jgi:hypothetical protein